MVQTRSSWRRERSVNALLNDDVLSMILIAALVDFTDVGKTSAVCSRWRLLITAEKGWTRVFNRCFGTRWDVVPGPPPPVVGCTHAAALRRHFTNYVPERRYMFTQPEASVATRAIVVAWMHEVIDYVLGTGMGAAFKTTETAVTTFDSYLAALTRHVPRSEFQLVASACIVYAILQTSSQRPPTFTGRGPSVLLARVARYTNNTCSAFMVWCETQRVHRLLLKNAAQRESSTAVFDTASAIMTDLSKEPGCKSCTFLWYLLELLMQTDGFLRWNKRVLAVAAVATVCHAYDWPTERWMQKLRKHRDGLQSTDISACAEIMCVTRDA